MKTIINQSIPLNIPKSQKQKKKLKIQKLSEIRYRFQGI
jgi:hypothetical protein